jgi:dihydropyrimidinase
MFELVIKNGIIIDAAKTERMDLGITNGLIAEIGKNLRGERQIDASGLYVLPGGIDPHVHLDMPVARTVSSDDWETGTIAAAIGGTTTIIDFVEPGPGQQWLDALAERRRQAEAKTVIDFGLHMTISDTGDETLNQVPEVIEAGVPSFKTYTTYDFGLDDDQLLKAFITVGESGGITLTHSENNAIIQYLRNKFISDGMTMPAYHPLSRPAWAEGEAVERVLAIARTAGNKAYIVHISTQLGAEALERAQKRGQEVYGETCPQYLLLDDHEYRRSGFEGAKFVCSPPLRKPEDNSYLWRALEKKVIQTVGTDHCPFYYHGQKDLGRDNFTQIPGGMPGIEGRLALIHTFGVVNNGLSLQDWVLACSTNAAQIFGMYPHKGCLQPGSDADVVLFDPNMQKTVSKDLFHENVDYTPYEGLQLKGYPVMSILRGEIIAENGHFTGQKRAGKFIPRYL